MEIITTVGLWAWDNRDEILLILTLIGGLSKQAWIIEAAKVAGKVIPKKKPTNPQS